MPASIEIDAPLTGSNVAQSFTAVGTYEEDAGSPDIIVTMSGPGGSESPPVDFADNLWSCSFNLGASGLGYTLTADISDGTSASDQQTDITVDGAPPIGMDPLDPLDAPLLEPATAALAVENYEVKGPHRPNVKQVIVAAVIFGGKGNGRKIESVEAVAIGRPGDPGPGRWKATLSINPLAAGKKLGVLAIGLSQKGEVLGKAFRRRK